MSSYFISKAVPLTQISLGFASIGASYSLVGAFTSPVDMMFIISTLDGAVQVSFDGTHDNIAVPKGSTTPAIIPLNFKENRMVFSPPSVFVKRIDVPTAGSLFVCAFSATIP